MSLPTADELALEALVTRVERGEPLSAAELEQLERGAERHGGGLDWQLCRAHALINSDQSAPALELLLHAPDEPLVRLARARALGALERYAEAAGELAQVLARAPAHADALRALGLIRLRQGAPQDAARLVKSVLARDPLDDAARQILAEAEEASRADVAPPPPDAFARDLRQSLAERGIKSRLDPGRASLLVELAPGRVGRFSLTSLHRAASADERGAAAFAESLVGSLSRLKAPEELPDLAGVRERVFPALRPARFVQKEGPFLSAPGPAGLVWAFALDHPGFVTFLPPQAALRWGTPLEEIAQLAMANLDRSPVAPTRFRARDERLVASGDGGWDVLAFDAGDGYDASRLLAPAHRSLLSALHPGPFSVALPTNAYALLAREGDAAGLAVLRAAALTESAHPDGHSRGLFRLDGGLEVAG